MIKTACAAFVLLTGIAWADVPPFQPDPQPIPDHPGEPDVPTEPGDIIAAFAALSVLSAGLVVMQRRTAARR